jgi:RNA polymerase sigma factor (sigma-70 family)
VLKSATPRAGNLKLQSKSRGGAGQFRTTQWDVVLLSAQDQAPGSEAALAELCQQYWYPLFGFARRLGYGPEDSQDLIQSFFLHLLAHRALQKVNPVKGRFRCFLLASLQNYLSNEASRSRCEKRGGKVKLVPLSGDDAEDYYHAVALDALPAGTAFDAQWAITVLDQAMSRLGQLYAAEGRTSLFEALKQFLDPLERQESPSYEQVANETGVSVNRIGVRIHRLRKQYTALLREEVARTVSDPQHVDDEIRALCEALIATSGRPDP